MEFYSTEEDAICDEWYEVKIWAECTIYTPKVGGLYRETATGSLV